MATARQLKKLQWRHRFAALVHFSAFWFLLGFAIDRSNNDLSVYDRQFWINSDKYSFDEPRRWLYKCFQNSSFTNSTSCIDDDKRFYVEIPPNRLKVNILAAALFYVSWSALLHLRASFVPEQTRVLRWADYSVTAPVMLLVLGLAFGADSVTALVFMPLLLCVLLLIACYVEQEADFTGPLQNSRINAAIVRATGSSPLFVPFGKMELRRQSLIAFILLAYIPVILPVLITSKKITNNQHDLDETTGVGQAPEYVFYFSLLSVMFFTLFAVVFVINLFKQFDRDVYYIYLSMVSKLSLHLFLGLAVIGQSNFVGVGNAGTESTDMATLRNAIYGCIAIVFVLAFCMWLLGKVYDRMYPIGNGNEEIAQLLFASG